MSLRGRTLITVGATMLALIAGLHFASRSTILPGFDALERQTVAADMERVASALGSRVEVLGRTASDWAPWDDTWEFVQDQNQDYVDANLGAGTLANLELTFMAFLDPEGRPVHVETIDLVSGEEIETPKALGDYLNTADQALLGISDTEANGGVVTLPDRTLMLMAAQQIRHSDYSGPTAGILVVGRWLDETEIAALSDLAGDPLRMLPLTGDAARTLRAAGLDPLEPAESAVTPIDEDTVAGHAVVRDIHGEPALLLQSRLPRAVHARGKQMLGYLDVALALLALAATGLIMWILSRQVLTPVSRLSRRVSEIGVSGDTRQRVWSSGSDEVSRLGQDINRMLEALDLTETELRRARDDLEIRVDQRTSELNRMIEALRTEVDERARAEEALRDSEQRYRALVQSMADTVFTLDKRGRFAFLNPRGEALTGYPAERLTGMSYQDVLTADSANIVRKRFNRASALRADTFEVELIDARGRVVPVELSMSALIGTDGEPAGVQGIARDITERKRFEAELLYMASHDYLTGLFNRRRFEEELERELAEARRHDRHGAVLWLDLDHFKEVNDSLGHRAGDEVLIALAEAFRERVREDSVLARLGGDEFAILMPGSDSREAQSAARRLLDELREQALVVSGHAVRNSASIGIVVYPDHGTSVEELLARADLAMYHAKEHGRNRFSVYLATDEWHAELASRRSWAERIEDALEKDALVVFAQPIVQVDDGSISRYELLVRMVGDDGALIPPDQFLGAAERLGLINEVDRWMLRRAVAIIAEWEDQGRQVKLDLNLSARALSDTEFPREMERVIKEAGIDSSSLGFEITETVIISDIGRAQDFVQRLKRLGCRFSLDDFGSGFSSFYHLKHLPIDHLKIDGSFIKRLPETDADQHLVRAMVELSRGLEIRTTAEYVENEQTLLLLREYGVDFAQGYFVGKPGPVSDVLQGRLPSIERTLGA